MKSFFLAVVAFFVLSGGVAQSVEIQPESVVCITQKYLKRFHSYESEGLTHLTLDMLDRAQCVKKKRSEDVHEVSRVGDFVQVIGQDGFKVWVMSDDFVPSGTSVNE